MKHIGHILPIVLAFILLFSSAACGGGGTTGGDSIPAEGQDPLSGGETPASETEAPETELIYSADYLPDTTYGGYEYKIVAYNEYPADQQEENGNLINDAIFRRNRLVEEQYDIKIAETRYPYAQYSDVYALLKKAALAQTDDYDLYTVVFPNAYSGIVERLIPVASSLPVIDMSQPWYYKQINDGMAVNGVVLTAYTAFDKSPGGQLIIFNKNMMTALQLDSPYDLVDSGTWTYEKFYTMGEAARSDLNGDGQMNEEDRFAMCLAIDDITDFAYYGSGLKLVDFGEEIPQVSQDERLYDMFDKMVGFLNTGTILNLALDGTTADKALQLFKTGHSLFHKAKTSMLVQLGDMEDDYGIVTYPKWTESQENYYNGIDGSLIALPAVSATDMERTCVIKEALSVESMNIYYPAYYEISLKNRYVRDQDSIRMLEIITKANTYDVGAALDYNAIRGPWLKCLENRSTDFVSTVTKNLKIAQKAIDKLIENTEEIKTDLKG